MTRLKKTREEIAESFHVNKSEIDRLFGCGRPTAVKIFNSASDIDARELGANYFNRSTVRLTSVLKVAGISEQELKQKVQA
jgi:hypothetical protein